MSENEILVILGNQLFPIEHIKKTNVNKIFMAEDFGLTTEHKHHKLKILMFLWSMRQYKDNLVKNGYEVYYHFIENDDFKDTFEDKFLEVIKKEDISKIKYFEIENHFFETRFNNFISVNNLNYETINNPMFLTSRLEFKKFVKSQKKFLGLYDENEFIHEIIAGMIGPEFQSIWDQQSIKQKVRLLIELENRNDVFEFELNLMVHNDNWQLCNINRIII